MTAFNPASQALPIVLFWLSFVLWTIFWVAVGVRKSTAAPSEGSKDGRALIALSLWLGVILALIAAWAVPAARLPGNGWGTLLAGLVCLWAGIGLRVWAIQTLGQYFRTIVMIQTNHQVIQDGPYRFIRHPSYAGTVLTAVGVGLALGSWLSILLGTAGAMFGFMSRIKVEESTLRERLGPSYESYMRRTWRLVPFVW